MTRPLRFAALAFAASALAACGVPAAHDPVADAAALERILGKADCADAFAEGPIALSEGVDCTINPAVADADAVGDIRLVVSAPALFHGAGETGTMRVEVVRLDGTSLQVIEEPSETLYFEPRLVNVDSGGALDLAITRNAPRNSVWAIWLATHDGTYVRAGELAGVTIDIQPDRVIAVPAASSAASWEIGFYFVSQEDRLEEMGRVEMSAVVDESGEFQNAWTCRLLSASDPAATQDYLCGMPAVEEMK